MPQNWTHVYNQKDSKYVGFFGSLSDAKKWVGRRAGFEITDRRPEPKTPVKETTSLVDQGLDAALAATKAEEADNAAAPTSSTN